MKSIRATLDTVFGPDNKPIDRPAIGVAERERIRFDHWRVEVPENPILSVVAEEYAPQMTTPTKRVCAKCRQDWGAFGCSTIRLLTLLEATERDLGVAHDELSVAYRALGRIGIQQDLALTSRGGRRHALEIHTTIDLQVLNAHSIEPVTHRFQQFIREIDQWIKERKAKAEERREQGERDRELNEELAEEM